MPRQPRAQRLAVVQPPLTAAPRPLDDDAVVVWLAASHQIGRAHV